MKKCKSGYYYCYTDEKCKPIPKGFKVVGRAGYLRKENGHSIDDNENGNGNGNGSGNGGNGNGSGNGGSNGGNGGGGMSEGTLHKWFKGSKSKDGKGGWVNVVTGGTCASDEPGEGTPKCVSSAKRASMTKAERKSAARRKKAADPGQQQKSGAAKPTYVSTDKKKMKKEEVEIIEGKDKKGKGSGTKDACYHKVKSRYSVWPSAYASGALVKCRKVGAANWGNSTKKESYELSNWRDDFKATEYEFTDVIKPEPIKGGVIEEGSFDINPKAHKQAQKQQKIRNMTQSPNENEAKVAKKKAKGPDLMGEAKKCWPGYEKKGTKKMFGKTYNNCVKKEETEIKEKKDPCWDTHKQVGMKKKGGKMVPNCVPKENYSNWRSEIEEGAAWTKKSGKNESGGLNEKGRKSYERENPGSDLKRPSKKVGNPRRKSFCARMKGMKKKLTSSKTANDPDSRINKSLRAWNC